MLDIIEMALETLQNEITNMEPSQAREFLELFVNIYEQYNKEGITLTNQNKSCAKRDSALWKRRNIHQKIV